MGPLLILSGPSGSGKSTVISRLLADQALPLRLSISVTTRSPRPGEAEGTHYYFWSPDRFDREIAAAGFLEWADVFGNRYGTLRTEVEPYRRQGQGVLLEIDVKGWEQVKRRCPDAVSIFLRASTLDAYEQRLRDRKTDSEAAIQCRLEGARAELARAPDYDYQVINDDLEVAVAQVREIVLGQFSR